MSLKLESELQKIGLSEKEAKVYLAGLELGPSTAQSIAAKAVVNRPTTYVMIESLIKRGLMSSFEKGKKRYFVTEQPHVLVGILDKADEILKEKRRSLAEIIQTISAFASTYSDRPKVRMYEDLAGLVQLQNEMLEIARKTGRIDTIAAVDDARNFVSEQSMQPLWKKINQHNIQVRALYTKSGPPQDEHGTNWQSRRLPKEQFPFNGELVFYGDTVSMLSYSDKIFGIVVESSVVSSAVKTLFELAWKAAESYI